MRNFPKKTWTWLKKWNLQIDTESLLIAAQNNAIRNNYVKAEMDKIPLNGKSRLCGDRDESINHISECNKSVQKEIETKHVWVWKMINWELCKELKFDHTTKWYMQKPESVLKNQTHQIPWDFGIQTDYLIPARRPDIAIVNKKRKRKKKKKKQKENQLNCELCHPEGLESKSQRKRKER